MWDVGTFQAGKENQYSSKSLLCNKQSFAKKIPSKCKTESHKKEDIRGRGLVRKTMLILWKLNDIDRSDDDSCHNDFPCVHTEMNFCSSYLNPALYCGQPFSWHLTKGPTIPFLGICRLLQFHKNLLFHQEALLFTLALTLHAHGPTPSFGSNTCSPHKSAILILH